MRVAPIPLALAATLTLALGARAQAPTAAPGPHDHGGHAPQGAHAHGTASHAHGPAAPMPGASHAGASTSSHAAAETRQRVRFPAPLRRHTLANMRDHLLTLGLIQEALAGGDYDRAATLAETRLGMSSLDLHGAHEVARYMPAGMQQAGSAMHRQASRFALAAKDGSASGDLRAPLDALGKLTQTCVACHAAYRLD